MWSKTSGSLRQRLPVEAALIWFLLAGIFCCPLIDGQAITGDLTINVTDPNGAAVPNAKLALKNNQEGTVVSGESNSQGTYNFSQLRPGSYSLTATAPGFQEQQVTDINIQLAQRASVNIKLTIGQ